MGLCIEIEKVYDIERKMYDDEDDDPVVCVYTRIRQPLFCGRDNMLHA